MPATSPTTWPDAQLVTVPGTDELWFTGDVEPIVSRVEAALGEI